MVKIDGGVFMAYRSSIFFDFPHWEDVPLGKIDSFHWENENPFRPASYAQLCGVLHKGLYARLWSYEENPRCVNTKRDEPVYEDSCLEFFLQPVSENPAYINFEMNCNGVYLSQYGEKRENRVFLKEFCSLEPTISCFQVTENGKAAWGVEIFLSEALISEIYKTDYALSPCEFSGNFYKCGDKTPKPHYGAMFPAGSMQLGFHNPSCFGKFILN